MTRDRFRPARVLFIAFVGLSCLRAWLGPLPLEREAQAQLPNSAASLTRIADQTRETNRLLQELVDHLKAGIVKVEVTNPPPPK